VATGHPDDVPRQARLGSGKRKLTDQPPLDYGLALPTWMRDFPRQLVLLLKNGEF
jgi:hypothetical protein